MSDIHEFREASIKLDADNLTFVAQARIVERWESVEFPVYLDRETVRTLPTVKIISADIRRKFQENSPLHTLLNGASGSMEFSSGSQTIQFSDARVVSWTVYGELDGEMMEEVEIRIEGEV
ncbi:MAG TPA: hypothetical protein VGB30_05885 [bacterium]|jgi:hypothetical protein